ncbi:MAG: hypothetical protein IE922_12910 [Sphingomonadales bacterium]|nr:hypothetical protein [Sphingomonadales bacterium]
MRRVIALAALVVLALGALLAWRLGWLAEARLALIEAQRAFQAPLAAGVRALKAHEPGAVAGLIWLGFLYGVLHAAGPGHGKVVLGGWALSARARVVKVAAITLAASLAQSAVAIALVLGGAWLFGLGRAELTDLAEGPVLRAGEWVLVALGAFLVARGLWHLRRHDRVTTDEHGHDHGHTLDHDHHASCGCGHAHAPPPEVAARASFAEAALLIAGVALRPCTGAVFVMLLTLLIGAPAAGVAAVLAMGLGTALITLAVALLGATFGQQLLGDARGLRLRRLADLAQIVVGLGIVALYL